MTTKQPYGGWINYRYLEQNKIMKNKLKFPTRARATIRNALARIGIKYKEAVAFYNPQYNGYKNQTDGSIQWLDYVLYIPEKKKILILLMSIKRPNKSGVVKRDKNSFKAKIDYLTDTGREFFVLPHDYSTQEYELVIRTIIRRMEKHEH